MTKIKGREIVVELERVRLVRKRACTTVYFCEHCWQETDFVSLRDAAKLFGLDEPEFSRSFDRGLIHFHDETETRFVCISSIVAHLSSITRHARPKTCYSLPKIVPVS